MSWRFACMCRASEGLTECVCACVLADDDHFASSNNSKRQDAGDRAKQMMVGEVTTTGTFLQIKDGRFVDDRWVGGRWDMSKFANAAGETDWDLVRSKSLVMGFEQAILFCLLS